MSSKSAYFTLFCPVFGLFLTCFALFCLIFVLFCQKCRQILMLKKGMFPRGSQRHRPPDSLIPSLFQPLLIEISTTLVVFFGLKRSPFLTFSATRSIYLCTEEVHELQRWKLGFDHQLAHPFHAIQCDWIVTL